MVRLGSILLIASLALLQLALTAAEFTSQPQQVHISYTNDNSQMLITWSTFKPTNSSTVEYFALTKHSGKSHHELREAGLESDILIAKGGATKFTDGGSEKRVQYIHRVLLTNLTSGMAYAYHCGDSQAGWSDKFTFVAMNTSADWSPTYAVFGDLGDTNSQSMSYLQEEAFLRKIDVVIHVGDFAYDMDNDNARVGDAFMNDIQPIASTVPYMVCPGNHESAYNFSNYINRFSMPNPENDNLFFSFNTGNIHWVGFSTEIYFYQFGLLAEQFKWLEQDLKEAARPENRKIRPWIITFGHRPMYCSNIDGDDCTLVDSKIRRGFLNETTGEFVYGLEDMFYKYGVDLSIWAHEHSYERAFPVYNYTLHKGSEEEPYNNPRAPVHVVTGSAGCPEGHDKFQPHPQPWSAFRNSDYGYAKLRALNSTHLSFEQLSNGKTVVDSFMLIKDTHGPYSA